MSKLKGWKEIPIGGLIAEPGTSREYHTGGWRTFRPLWDAEKCTHCLFCFMFCPDSAIKVEDGKMTGIEKGNRPFGSARAPPIPAIKTVAPTASWRGSNRFTFSDWMSATPCMPITPNR